MLWELFLTLFYLFVMIVVFILCSCQCCLSLAAVTLRSDYSAFQSLIRVYWQNVPHWRMCCSCTEWLNCLTRWRLQPKFMLAPPDHDCSIQPVSTVLFSAMLPIHTVPFQYLLGSAETFWDANYKPHRGHKLICWKSFCWFRTFTGGCRESDEKCRQHSFFTCQDTLVNKVKRSRESPLWLGAKEPFSSPLWSNWRIFCDTTYFHCGDWCKVWGIRTQFPCCRIPNLLQSFICLSRPSKF